MSETAGKSEPTASQRRVMEWLLAYPAIELLYTPGRRRVQWSASWADEKYRLDMIEAMKVLGGPHEHAHPQGAPIPGPTPRCVWQTFEALHKRGWVKQVRRWDRNHWAFGITRAGIAAIRLPTERARSVND